MTWLCLPPSIDLETCLRLQSKCLEFGVLKQCRQGARSNELPPTLEAEVNVAWQIPRISCDFGGSSDVKCFRGLPKVNPWTFCDLKDEYSWPTLFSNIWRSGIWPRMRGSEPTLHQIAASSALSSTTVHTACLWWGHAGSQRPWLCFCCGSQTLPWCPGT